MSLAALADACGLLGLLVYHRQPRLGRAMAALMRIGLIPHSIATVLLSLAWTGLTVVLSWSHLLMSLIFILMLIPELDQVRSFLLRLNL